MILVRSETYSLVDRLMILWAICMLDHYKEDRKMLAPYYMAQEFGERVTKTFNIACEMADSMKLIDLSYMQLTKRGQIACSKWQQISSKILEV